MGCYRATRAFLERIGTADKLRWQDRLAADVRRRSARGQADVARCRRRCRCCRAVRLPSLPWRDRLALVKVAAAIQLPSRLLPPATDWETVDGWLDRLGQSAAARRAFLHPLALAALNDDPRTAIGQDASRRCCARRSSAADDARLGMARVGLSRSLRRRRARVAASARRDGAARRRRRARRRRAWRRARRRACAAARPIAADAVIAACPPAALVALVDAEWREGETWWAGLRAAADVADRVAAPVARSPRHRRGDHRLRRLAAALDLQSQPLVDACAIRRAATCRWWCRRRAGSSIARRRDRADARRRARGASCPKRRARACVHARVIKERDATIAHTAGTEGLRPRCQSPIEGLFAAGDYVRTGLPATIESAVRAADDAADAGAGLGAAARGPGRASPGAFVPLSRLKRPEVTPE